jgi:hypothetical protein
MSIGGRWPEKLWGTKDLAYEESNDRSINGYELEII